jgi:hypothetical protein
MQQSEIDDLFGFTAPKPEQLQIISVYANKAIDLKRTILATEQYLETLNNELEEIEEKKIPDALKAVGMRQFEMEDGSRISIKPKFEGGVIEGTDKKGNQAELLERRQKQLEWIIANGGQDLIKDEIKIKYGRSSFEEAKKTKELLKEQNIGFENRESVHAGSLGAWVKELIIDEGKIIPGEELNALGWRFFYKAEIKIPK